MGSPKIEDFWGKGMGPPKVVWLLGFVFRNINLMNNNFIVGGLSPPERQRIPVYPKREGARPSPTFQSLLFGLKVANPESFIAVVSTIHCRCQLSIRHVLPFYRAKSKPYILVCVLLRPHSVGLDKVWYNYIWEYLRYKLRRVFSSIKIVFTFWQIMNY